MPWVLTTRDCVFVHAGLDFKLPLREADPWFMVWERDWRFPPEKLEGRTLICGHTKTPLYQIRASLTERSIWLDNGCWCKRIATNDSTTADELAMLVTVKKLGP